MTYKPTIAIDFDGVINSYTSGWSKTSYTPEADIPDEPVPGAREEIARLRQHYKIVVYSTRAKSEAGVKAMKNWLEKHGIEVDNILHTKLPATVLIDDRAICFDGNWTGMLEKVRDFKTWMEK